MVSLQTTLSTKERNTNWFTIFGEPSKKRKLCDDDEEVQSAAKELKLWTCSSTAPPPTSLPSSTVFVDDIELQLEDSPLPPEWQRCLDIKSGRIHFYNTRTSERTTKVPLSAPDPPATISRQGISLDLELNLGCESPTTKTHQDHQNQEQQQYPRTGGDDSKKKHEVDLRPNPEETEHREMVAAACMRCHMLVMMSKSSPSCPNCKFMHETHVGSTAGSFVSPGFSRHLCGGARSKC